MTIVWVTSILCVACSGFAFYYLDECRQLRKKLSWEQAINRRLVSAIEYRDEVIANLKEQQIEVECECQQCRREALFSVN